MSQQQVIDISPPRTPPSQSARYRPSRRGQHARPSVRETFLDDMNPPDNATSSNDSGSERDPHDLSLSPQHAARTSIVDNMLLSLDQFALSGSSVLDDYRLFNSVFESDVHNRPSQDSMTQGRFRGHTFSSSLSSDPDFNYDDSAGRYGMQPAPGRRSNSSSNYQSSVRRIGSSQSREGISSRGQLYSSNTAPRTHAAGKSSKGSSSSNADFATPFSRARADSEGEKRSSSFEYGSRQPFMPFPEAPLGYDTYDGVDAAPTPNVPAGPRKHLPSQDDHTGTLSHQSSRTPVASRRNSMKSSRTNHSKKPRPENIGTATIRSPGNDLDNLDETGLEPPTMPASLEPPAPSPTISYNKPIFPPPEPAPVKERPGFFRRVFGSSKNPESQGQPDLPYPENDSKDSFGVAASLKARKPPTKTNVATGSNNSVREGPPQVVNKKSSFFRRRKKSVVETVPPPIMLPQEFAPRPFESFKAEPSPVSSLRKVMNPYLDHAPPPQHPDREGSLCEAELPRPKYLQTQRQMDSIITPNAGSRSKYAGYPSGSSSGHDTSFLANSSGDEDPTAKSGDLDPSASLESRQGQHSSDHRPKAAIYSHDSIVKPESDKLTNISQNKLAPPHAPSSPLSPVAEDISQKSAMSAEFLADSHSLSETESNGNRDVHDTESSKDQQDGSAKLPIPVDGANESASEISNYYTASNTPVMSPEEPRIAEEVESDAASPDDTPDDEPTGIDRDQAQKLFDSQDQVVGNEPAAAWLGDPDRATIREAYMDLFDWSNMNILAALRSLCNRLVLKGETQQVDRVLDAFSTRWCECNPRHGFKAADVVHTICYSLLLLNTDLHLADIESKMTKNQFVRNTMPTIHRVAIDAAPDSFDTLRPINKPRAPIPFQDMTLSAARSNSLPIEESDRGNTDTEKPVNQPTKLLNRMSRTDLSGKMNTDYDGDSGPLVNNPFNGTVRAWEQQVETVLKDFYNSIQKQKLPLHGAQPEKDGARMSNNLLGPNSNSLRRSPSTLSKSGSDIYPRGRSADSRYGTARWSSKPRSRVRLYPPSTMGSSRTSLDDQSSLWSPSASSTWSKYSLGKLTSASVDSFGSDYPRGEYQQSIGFANALSQAIIREDSANSIASSEDHERMAPLLEDETLELAGAPWAKEGSLKHKHHLDSVEKRAKDRNWNECFAVIQQGWMRLFSFSNSTKSVRQKAKQRQNGGVIVGGGNWMSNAEEIWKFLLRQTIASALPPPGYSKSRPHVWALSLPTGAVHLFQAGTPEIVREFVSSANYWSARLSKEPLVGGISNIEYGWSDAVINSALINTDQNGTPPSSSGARPSIQSSIRSSLDQQGVRPRLPADRVHISDWAPPQQSMVASALSEPDQLKALQNYVKNVEDDLTKHNELRPAMVLSFSPRHPNATKAMANWEKKSSYLLREIVKFRTYIDSLQAAFDHKNKIYSSHEGSHPEDDQTTTTETPVST
ncbi:hypothetical protein MW887_002899 [Aspergillus wentii]|nr:hypothetical protein MW887_002899 [Aspergillus wentii]